MGRWIFTGDSERYFGDSGLMVSPGDRIDAEECPDPHFFTEVKPRAKTATEKAPTGRKAKAADTAEPAVEPEPAAAEDPASEQA